MKRIFALIIAILMVASCFVACKKDDESAKNPDSTEGNNVVSTDAGEYVSKLPEDMNWGGETYLVLGQSDQGNAAWECFEIARDELPDDIVGKAVWERNDALKQKYNIIIDDDLVTQSHLHIQSFYASNEDKYDMVMYQLEGVFAHMQSGYLLDLTETSNIDLDHPAWNTYSIEQLTFGDSVYCATSDFNLQNKYQFSCIFYNREMARDAGDGYIEELVYSGNWTFDKFNELIVAYAEDASGNGVKGDEADIFGLCGDKAAYLYYAVGGGYRASTVTGGQVAMAGAGDSILNILDRAGKFFFNSQANFITESVKPLDYWRSINIFSDKRALFLSGAVGGIDEEFNFEFSVLPQPKLDTNQTDYYTQVNPIYSSLCALPKTVLDTEFAGFGLEALVEYSTDTTLKTFVEEKCKLQGSFDQRMSDMFGYIFENPVYDLAIVGNFGNLRSIMMTRLPESKNASRYATMYSSAAEAAQENINQMIEDLG